MKSELIVKASKRLATEILAELEQENKEKTVAELLNESTEGLHRNTSNRDNRQDS